MCLIVVKNSKDGNFAESDFKLAYNRNSDGMGIMFVRNGRLVVEKLMGNQNEQLKLYQRHKDRDAFVLHLRLKTHGEKNEANCHPFKILSIDDGDPIDLYAAHNGTISDAHTTDKTMSDSWNFFTNQIAPVLKKDHTLLYNAGFQALVNSAIGGNNKLVFMDNLKNILVFNTSKGTIKENCWLSNTNFIPTTTQSYGSFKNGRWIPWEEEFDNEEKVNGQYYSGQGYYFNGEYYTFHEYEAVKKKAIEDAKIVNLPVVAEEKKNVTPDIKETQEVVTEAEIETEEYDEDEDLLDEEEKMIISTVEAMYDSAQVDKQELSYLIEYAKGNFFYRDLEVIVEEMPQVATDMLERLLKDHKALEENARIAS